MRQPAGPIEIWGVLPPVQARRRRRGSAGSRRGVQRLPVQGLSEGSLGFRDRLPAWRGPGIGLKLCQSDWAYRRDTPGPGCLRP